MTDDGGVYITVQEAADALGVQVRQVYNHMQAGRIHSIKRGKRRLLRAEDVRRLADELAVTGRDIQRSANSDTAEQLPVVFQQYMELQKEVGRLEEQLRTRLTPEQADELRRELAEERGKVKALEGFIERYHQEPQPQQRRMTFWEWWRRRRDP